MRKIFTVLLATLFFMSLAFSAMGADVQLMTTEQLNKSLNDPSVVILDARGSWDWVKTGDKIASATRIDPSNPDKWIGNYDKEKTIVLYCA